MSQSTTSSTSFTAVAIPSAETQFIGMAARLFPGLAELPTSVELRRLSATLGAVPGSGLKQAEAVRLRLADARVGFVLRAMSNPLRHGESLLEEARAAAASGDGRRANELGAVAALEMRRAVATCASGFADDERRVVARSLQLAAHDIGFMVRTAVDVDATRMLCVRGDHVLALVVSDGGSVQRDHAGLGGATCRAIDVELESAAARRGLRFGTAQTIVHGDPRGGGVLADVTARFGLRSRSAVGATTGVPVRSSEGQGIGGLS